MKKWLVLLLLGLFCLSVDAVNLEHAFQLGEKQEPRLDRLLPGVARQMAFNADSTKLIAKGMGGTVVEWDIRTRQKQEVGNIQAKRWFAYSAGANQLLVRKVNNNITLLDRRSGDETLLTNGEYESGSLSADGTLAVLSKGDNGVEIWQLAKQRPKSVKRGTAQKLKTFQTGLPVRNGLKLSHNGKFIAAAEGTYRDGEGHRAIIEIWNLELVSGCPQLIQVINTGEILGVWNLLFSPDATMLAVDTQKNNRSGIRVWDFASGRQLLHKDGFEAYWTRALAFSSSANYLVSGDEGGNLRVWDIRENGAVFWETYPTGIQALAFSPSGEYLAVALWDATIQIRHWRSE